MLTLKPLVLFHKYSGFSQAVSHLTNKKQSEVEETNIIQVNQSPQVCAYPVYQKH